MDPLHSDRAEVIRAREEDNKKKRKREIENSNELFLAEIKRVFLDENINVEMDRCLKIMRMLQFAYEDEMSQNRKEFGGMF